MNVREYGSSNSYAQPYNQVPVCSLYETRISSDPLVRISPAVGDVCYYRASDNACTNQHSTCSIIYGLRIPSPSFYLYVRVAGPEHVVLPPSGEGELRRENKEKN